MKAKASLTTDATDTSNFISQVFLTLILKKVWKLSIVNRVWAAMNNSLPPTTRSQLGPRRNMRLQSAKGSAQKKT